MIYAANVAEDDLASAAQSNRHVATLQGKAAEEGCDVVIVSAQVRETLSSPTIRPWLTLHVVWELALGGSGGTKPGVSVCRNHPACKRLYYICLKSVVYSMFWSI
jgi:hypothetical protein